MIFNFMIFVASRKGRTANFSPSSYVAIVESGIWDPKIRIGMHKNQDPGSGICNTATYTEVFLYKKHPYFPICDFRFQYRTEKQHF
jgi:hypothetical protein